MRTRLIAGVLALFVVVGVVLGVVRFGITGLFGVNDVGQVTTPTLAADNPIARENAQVGSIGWQIPFGHAATTQIQAYAGANSVAPGQSISFFTSVQIDNTKFRIDIYRLGWYAGTGGRLMASSDNITGKAQGYFDISVRPNAIINCKKCSGNGIVEPFEANWDPSYTLKVPQDWTTGIYLAKFTDAQGMQTYSSFDVLGSPNATYVAMTPDTTEAAYNYWGGPTYSLYDTDTGSTAEGGTATRRSAKVSFNKPYLEGSGSGQVMLYEVQMVRWMEQHNYDVSYISSVDLQLDSGQLAKHKAFISLGHDEYWTREMRDNVEAARDRGTGLAFMGADAVYWQMRFESDKAGHANRTVVCYKVATTNGKLDLQRDPFYGKDDTRVTSEFRDPIVGRPENTLIGIMFNDLTHKRMGYPWTVSPTAKTSLLNGTNLQAGKSYGCVVVGYEWDSVSTDPHAPSPKGLQVIAASDVVPSLAGAVDGPKEVGHTTYYVASSGALVFASGSIYWATILDSFRSQDQLVQYRGQQDLKARTCPTGFANISGMQKMMENVMAALIVKHTPGGVI